MTDIFDIPKSLLEAAVKVLLSEHEMSRGEVAASDKKYGYEISMHRKIAASISGHIFPNGQDRISLPLTIEEHPTKKAVESHLSENGFHSTDYANGITKDSFNRSITIGKALTKSSASKELIDQFATHQKTYKHEPDTSGLQVVISKHPHDVIGMSQGTQWGLRPGEVHSTVDRHNQSCMRFGTHQHDTHMANELFAGTHIAWLTKKGDDEAKEPISRITLRPFTKSASVDEPHHDKTVPGTYIRVPTESIYGHTSGSSYVRENIASLIGEDSVQFSHTNAGNHYYKLNGETKPDSYVVSANNLLVGHTSKASLVNYHVSDDTTKVKKYHFDIPKTSHFKHEMISDNSHMFDDLDDFDGDKDALFHSSLEHHLMMNSEDDEYNPHNLQIHSIEHVGDSNFNHRYNLVLSPGHPALPDHIYHFLATQIPVSGLHVNNSDLHEFDGKTLKQFPSDTQSDKSNDHTILVPGHKMYGNHSDSFKHTVDSWVDKNFEPHKNSIYSAKSGVYLDGDPSSIQT